MEPEKSKQAAGLVGWAARGLFLVGVASLLVALVALWTTGKTQTVATEGVKTEAVQTGTVDYQGAGVCLIASALGFGLLLNGLLRR